MSKFFINRPNFAWVIAIFISLAGLFAIKSLPVSQYPDVAPPQVMITATYPGASAEVLNNSVASIIEEELNGAKGLLYFESASDSTGAATITATFKPGTDPDLALVDVQNRIKRVEARLPQSVTQQGLQVEQAMSSFLMLYTIGSESGDKDAATLADFAVRSVNNEIRRIPGVGRVMMFGGEKAMRIWVNPQKLAGFGLSILDVNKAILAQNIQIAAGNLADLPNEATQEITASIQANGQLKTIDEFSHIVLRSFSNGSSVVLGDVARIEMGSQDYRMSSRLNGKTVVAVAVQLSPGANALETATKVKARLSELSSGFPKGFTYATSFDTSLFVDAAITKVVHTLVEAMVLVFLVMLLFLQNFRYTLIPTIVVPVSLLGTFAVMLPLGYSVNMMTMFGMVLAIGILVDDAIVVVENVERLMSEEGLDPKHATLKAMKQISGAIVGITLVLAAVFLPLAFMDGSVGVIYRQFSISLAISILFSGFLALTLTPALSATLIKPVAKGHHLERKGFYGWFNRVFRKLTQGFTDGTHSLLRRTGRMMLVYLALVAVLAFAYLKLPSGFLPTEDQGYMMAGVQLPSTASTARTLEINKDVEQFFMARPEVENVLSLVGYGFSGNGQNASTSYVTFKDWSKRSKTQTTLAVANEANMALAGVREGTVYALVPPAIDSMGNSSGFSLRLQDRAGLGRQALQAAGDQLAAMASLSSVIAYVMPEGMGDAPQIELTIDRAKAAAMGVGLDTINASLSTAFASMLTNEFPNAGRMQRVIVQAEPNSRQTPEDLGRLKVPNDKGELVPLEAFTSMAWKTSPIQAVRYNGYPSLRYSGDVKPGHSTGEAMKEIEGMISKLPKGIGYEWTGISYQEKAAGSQAPALLALSLLVVFLLLVALYESWAIPASVLLIVPIGALGSVIVAHIFGLSNDVYFKVALVTIIGLAAKNAILIIEFAKDLHAQGKTLRAAALEAVRIRFRPILMTSFAFILGVLPLAFASGAGAASQSSIGLDVFGGMLSASLLGVLFVPVFFVWVLSRFGGNKAHQVDSTHHKADHHA